MKMVRVVFQSMAINLKMKTLTYITMDRAGFQWPMPVRVSAECV